MTGHDPHSAAPPSDAPPATFGHKVSIYATLAVAVLIAVGLMTAIGIRWMNQRVPSSIVVFHSNAAQVESVIYISCDDGANRAPVTIHQTTDFTTPIFLEPGSYSFTVKKGEKIVYQDAMYVAEGCRYDIDLIRPSAP